MLLRMFMAFAVSFALSTFPSTSSPQHTSEHEAWLAVQDAVAVPMQEPAFQEAAWAGRAFVMKDFLVHNGAPPDLVLSAEGFSHESTDAGAAIPLSIDKCVKRQLVVWKIVGIVYTRAVCIAWRDTTKVHVDPRRAAALRPGSRRAGAADARPARPHATARPRPPRAPAAPRAPRKT